MHHFCTYFDTNYLSRALALIHSLQQNCRDFCLWVLCLDNNTFSTMNELSLPQVRLITLETLEQVDPDLKKSKYNRSRIEYYFTCTPSLCLYIFNSALPPELLTYVDTDLFFFSDPTQIVEEMGESSIAITEHRFPEKLSYLKRYGIYNKGWLCFRRNDNALSCLSWWRENCIDWCYDTVEDNRYADQKYIDQWPLLFEGVKIIGHKGINTAPWNIENYCIKLNEHKIYIDDHPLVSYHFQGIRRVTSTLYDSGVGKYRVRLKGILRESIYAPYIHELIKSQHQLKALSLPKTNGIGSSRVSIHTVPIKQILVKMRRLLQFVLLTLLNGNLIKVQMDWRQSHGEGI